MPTGKNETILLREDKDGICTLTLNRPEKRNAMSIELVAELQSAFDTIAEDKSVKVIILAGNGPIFCSGHDLRDIRGDSSYEAIFEMFQKCSNMMISMKKQPQPIIARVHGIAMAAGCQLMASCDLAVAVEEAKFAVPGVTNGLFCSTPAVALSRAASAKHTMEMLLMGDLFSAEDALRFGLINKVVKPEELDAAVMAYATSIASRSTLTISMGKPAFYEQLDMDLEEAYAYTTEVMAKNMQEHDAQEGIDAFLEKRDPVWRGR
ncbi:MAG: enoyl-CoA hydratase [Rhodospirillaceae bacterium]|jgi:enoyl-CoA hydratase/carnithine racemase|nr:enoyl-CoA hydratase [Rhodospirillaceae bacterium]MBT5941891.1 enoyl-CoA hydratase [Rhodospirillaceae bacterium]MBT7956036.1 enoyl-CoA hydratase [Rhodospirillaceae bacterium]